MKCINENIKSCLGVEHMKHKMPSYEVENRAVEYTAVLQNILSEILVFGLGILIVIELEKTYFDHVWQEVCTLCLINNLK